MHYTKEASQNACICIFLCINIVINNFGSYLSSLSILLAFLLTFLNSYGRETISKGRRWIYTVEWLVFIRHTALFSATCQGITEILVLLSKPHPLDSFIPTLYLPKQIISIFVVILILILLCFGLENSSILDGLVLGSVTGAVILYAIAAVVIHSTGHFASPLPAPFNIDQIFLVCGLIKPFFVETNLLGSASRLWTNIFIFIIYFFITVFIPSFEDVVCVDEGQIALLCPINSKFKWYEMSMGCLALVAFGTLLPSIASRPALSLVTPTRLGIRVFSSESSTIRKSNVKALTFVGILVCLMTYWIHIYQLLFVNAIATLLQELLSTSVHLYYFYTPTHLCTEKARKVSLKESSYEPVVISSEDPNQNISLQDVALSESDSSDTDIDSIVEEYNDKIRVLSGADNVKKSPTDLTSKTSYCCLIFISGLSICISLALLLQFFILASYTTLGVFLLVVLLLWLPRRNVADFKTTLRLIINLIVSNILIVPLFSIYSAVVIAILITIGFLFYVIPHMRTKISIVKSQTTIKLKCFTDSLYSTKVFNVQRRSAVPA